MEVHGNAVAGDEWRRAFHPRISENEMNEGNLKCHIQGNESHP